MKFDYLARTHKGEVQAGTVEAPNRTEALQTLQKKHDLIVTRLWASDSGPLLSRKIKFFERVKRKEIFIFFRQLSILIEAGVPLLQALKVLNGQMTNPAFKDVVFKAARDIDGGMSFSKAVAKHPAVFSVLVINLIKIGEVSGRLQESLTYLADYLEKEYYFISKVRSAMIYPLFILSAFIVVAVLLMLIVIPSLTAILVETGQELPLSTRIVIGSSDFIRQWGWAILLLAIISVPAFVRFQRTQKGRNIVDRAKLKLPVFGKIIKKVYLARFADNVSVLVKGGISIVQSLNISGQIVGNVVFQQIIFQTRDEVKAGHGISSTLEKFDEFPPLFCQMMRTGEETGKLESIAEKLGKFYGREVENIVNNLSQLIEPLLMLMLGIGAGILVFAVFMPIYNMVGAF